MYGGPGFGALRHWTPLDQERVHHANVERLRTLSQEDDGQPGLQPASPFPFTPSGGPPGYSTVGEFYLRVGEVTGVGPERAHEQVRGVLAALIESLGDQRLDQVVGELRRELACAEALPAGEHTSRAGEFLLRVGLYAKLSTGEAMHVTRATLTLLAERTGRARGAGHKDRGNSSIGEN